MSRVRVLGFKLMGMKVEGRVRLSKIELPRNPWDIMLKNGVALDNGVVLLTTGDPNGQHRIVLGSNVYVNRYTMFDASASIIVGDATMIGPFCYITDHDHGTEEGLLVGEQPLVEAPVKIGRNVWIGADVTILKGVTIGDNAVIGAGSVVTRSVAANERVVGITAKAVKSSALKRATSS